MCQRVSREPFVCIVEPSAPVQSAELAPCCAAATHGEAINQLKKNCVSSDMFAKNEQKDKAKNIYRYINKYWATSVFLKLNRLYISQDFVRTRLQTGLDNTIGSGAPRPDPLG